MRFCWIQKPSYFLLSLVDLLFLTGFSKLARTCEDFKDRYATRKRQMYCSEGVDAGQNLQDPMLKRITSTAQ